MIIRGQDQQVVAEDLPRPETAEVSQGVFAPLARIPTFRALGYRNFRYLLFGQLSHSAAVWIEQVARPILVLALTDSAVHLGLILATRTLPQLFFGLIGGVLADWFDRRKLMLVSKALSMTVDFSFAALVLSGNVEIWHVYVTTFLKGVTTSFDSPARQSLIPSLVPIDGLANAVALNTASMNLMRIGGAFFAGILLATAGVGITFLTVGVMTSCAVFFTFRMRVPPMLAATVENRSGKAAALSLLEGARFAWETREIRGIFVLMLCYFALAMAYMQVFAPLLAKQAMGVGDGGFGIMMSTTGIGALIGTLTIATLSPSRWKGAGMLILMATLGTLLCLFAASTYLPYVVLPFIFIGFVGMASSSFVALGNIVLLQAAPEEKRGRIMGFLSLDRSMITFGGTIAGFLAAAVGAQLAQISFGIGLIMVAISMAVVYPSLRRVH